MSDRLNRCRVVCHMVTSIDGKITGKFEEQAGAEAAGNYYMETLEQYSKCMAIGRVTSDSVLEGNEVDLTEFREAEVPDGDFIIKNPESRYYISFDRKGRCFWKSSTFEHEGMPKYMYLEVVTAQAPKEYLAYLRSIGLPYIIAGEIEMDIPLALKKLKQSFGIEQLALCGGAILNGAFFKADMVDELSLVMFPYIEGDVQAKSVMVMDFLGEQHYKKLLTKKTKIIEGGGVHLVFTKEK